MKYWVIYLGFLTMHHTKIFYIHYGVVQFHNVIHVREEQQFENTKLLK